MKTCLVPGAFDPVTFGHVDIMERAAALFDSVVVAILRNSAKEGWLTWDERIHLLSAVITQSKAANRVRVIKYEGSLVDCARDVRADAIIRGLRSVSDFEYEVPWAMINRSTANVETLFFMSPPELTPVSSSAARELAAYGEPLDLLVPAGAIEILRRTGRIK